MNLLTPAERRYLGLLAGGLTPQQIASHLNIDRNAVYCAFYQMRKKVGVKSTTQLVSEFLTRQTRSK